MRYNNRLFARDPDGHAMLLTNSLSHEESER